MERFIEFFFDHVLKEIFGEGERRIKLQALSVAHSTVLGTRKLILIVFFYCFACFLSALSLLGTLFVATEQWMSGNFLWWDPRLLVCAGVFVVSTLMLMLTVREKSWAGAFGLEEKIEKLERENSAGGGFSEAQVMLLIERVLDERARVRTPVVPVEPDTSPDTPPTLPKDKIA